MNTLIFSNPCLRFNFLSSNNIQYKFLQMSSSIFRQIISLSIHEAFVSVNI